MSRQTFFFTGVKCPVAVERKVINNGYPIRDGGGGAKIQFKMTVQKHEDAEVDNECRTPNEQITDKVMPVQVERELFCLCHELTDERQQVFAVPGFLKWAGNGRQLAFVDVALPVGDFFDAADFDAGALFDDADVFAGVVH